jgi:N-formylglutamate deformylase
MPLPLVISVPHAGLGVPPRVAAQNALTAAQIARDGDEQADTIYAVAADVAHFLSPEVARAFVDLNRAEDDRRADGVVKTHTCWGDPVYREPLELATIDELLAEHHRPYHAQLTAWSTTGARLGLDCHTMAAHGPPVGPDPGAERPWVCLSHGDGTCPEAWMRAMLACMVAEFGDHVRVNDPFRGGHITRSHAAEMPWMQIELSRAAFAPVAAKHRAVRRALHAFVARVRP